eukprot:CAMPEP_0194399858 /NCGR_PEP_ID=MMETSP0174-20130528/126891_1 /TAXON_ID=216777 /ORGANISM="Proboscia alata, Strain PI-D3" /LENGTH=253 /DNA_ID=CAMNT_0039196309 /DNA_START=741 /DNA_END=1499 /DNA_ORIENTATION=-
MSILMTDLLRTLTKNNARIAKSVLNMLCVDFMKDIESTDDCFYTKRISVGKPKQTKGTVLNAEKQIGAVEVGLDGHCNKSHETHKSENVVVNCNPAKKVDDTGSVDNAVKDQTYATFYEPRCICGVRTSVSEVIVSNIRTFLEPIKASPNRVFASNARDAILTACTFGMSSNMNEVRKSLGLNKAFHSKIRKCRNVRLNEYEPPTRKKFKSKHGDIQKECVLEFCHPGDSSTTDIKYHQTITMKGKKHHLPNW